MHMGALRHLISHHSSYPDANWSFPTETLQRLSTIRDLFEPNDPVITSSWLFGEHPELPEIDTLEDYDRYNEELTKCREVAIEAIVNASGFNGISRLLLRPRKTDSIDAHAVGWIVGTRGLLCWGDVVVPECVLSSQGQIRNFVSSYISARFDSDRFALFEAHPLSGLEVNQVVNILLSIPFVSTTWDWIDANTIGPVRDGPRIGPCSGRHVDAVTEFAPKPHLSFSAPLAFSDDWGNSWSD